MSNERMNFQIALETVLTRLKTELPDDLTYHHAGHTEDVIQCSERLARAEGVSEGDIILIKTAALLHDSGFLYNYKNHEENSVIYAREILPELGYGQLEIDQISEMIMATRVPQSPKSKLGKILCDADLDYLGREDYYPVAYGLFLEFKKYGILQTDEEWLKIQIRFLESHHYFTETSIIERTVSKQAVLFALKARAEAAS